MRAPPEFIVWLAPLVVGLALVAGCHASKSAPENVSLLLDRCPEWTQLNGDDRGAKQKILLCLAQISTNDIRDIRIGVTKFLHTQRGQAESGKIFLLNRYLFNVPELGEPDDSIVTPWHSPTRSGRLDLLWPFSLMPKGDLELTGNFKGYTGESYRPLDEFDYFLKTYGRRTPSPRSRVPG
jgi:hypothetical protein